MLKLGMTRCRGPATLAVVLVLVAHADDGRLFARGTVNIVLANRSGLVAVTDSYQTLQREDGRYAGTILGQKLFVLDQTTVCTIAGFASAPLRKFPEFMNSAAEIVEEFVEETRARHGLTFHQKLMTLVYLFQRDLELMGNLGDIHAQGLADVYGLELILAGYDLDGVPKLSKFAFRGDLSPSGVFVPTLTQVSERVAGQGLIHETAGIGASAVENILAHPGQLGDEPGIAQYARSPDRGATLNPAELERLGRALASHSALVSRVYVVHPFLPGRGFVDVMQLVGGPQQVASVFGGKVESVVQPTFAERPARTKRFHIWQDMTFDGNGVQGIVLFYVMPADLIAVHIRGELRNGTVVLDNGYYSGVKFSHCRDDL